MGSFSIWHWMIVLVIVLLVFGRGKIPELMGDMAKGIKSFKKGMSEDEEAEERRRLTAERTVEAQPVPPSPAAAPAEPVVTPAPDADRQA